VEDQVWIDSLLAGKRGVEGWGRCNQDIIAGKEGQKGGGDATRTL